MKRAGWIMCQRYRYQPSPSHPCKPMPSLPPGQVVRLCMCPARVEGVHWHPVYEDGSVGWWETVKGGKLE